MDAKKIVLKYLCSDEGLSEYGEINEHIAYKIESERYETRVIIVNEFTGISLGFTKIFKDKKNKSSYIQAQNYITELKSITVKSYL